MQNLKSWRLTKARCIKALMAAFIALIAFSNLGVTRSAPNHTVPMPQQQKVELPVKKVDERLIAATSRFAFKLYNQVLKQRIHQERICFAVKRDACFGNDL